jgi:hypothetical protein
VFLVSVTVETEGDDGLTTRIYSIPIIVHGAPAPANPADKPPALAAAATAAN